MNPAPNKPSVEPHAQTRAPKLGAQGHHVRPALSTVDSKASILKGAWVGVLFRVCSLWRTGHFRWPYDFG